MLELADDSSCPLPGDSFSGGPRETDHAEPEDRRARVELVWPELVAMVQARRGEGCTLLFGEPPRAIVLGGLYDHARAVYRAVRGAPSEALLAGDMGARPLADRRDARTRLDTRSRVAFTPDAVQWASVWTHPFSDFMRHDELELLKRRAEAARRR